MMLSVPLCCFEKLVYLTQRSADNVASSVFSKEGASARKTQTPAAQPVPRPGKVAVTRASVPPLHEFQRSLFQALVSSRMKYGSFIFGL